MRILYINTVDVAGGAAVVMQRLMQGLHRKYQTENLLLVKDKQADDPYIKPVLTNRAAVLTEKAIDRVSRQLGLLYQFFPFSSASILKAATEFRPHVINLHNSHGGYFATPLLYRLSQVAPVVWTLHDMWSFTGNAAHTFGNTSWRTLQNDRALTRIPPSIGINTGAYLLRQKKRIYQKSNLSIVTPSRWLYDLAVQSPVFAGKAIHHIYNGVETSIYNPEGKEAARRRLNLPAGEPVIIFMSHFLHKNNPWKGGADLLEILRAMNRLATKKITLLMLGEGKLEELNELSNLNILYRGYVHGDAAVSECLRAADLFIYPTRADNLPNVLVEAIACGTPCITFDIGGNKEIVQHEVNGIVVKPFDIAGFAEAATALLYNKTRLAAFAEQCTTIARNYFLLDDMIEKYYALFQQVQKKQ